MGDQISAVRTTCPYCGVGCGLLAKVDDKGNVSVKGDPDHPANYSRLCSKGTALGETVGLEGRLLKPSIHGKPADWDQALETIAERFSEILETDGPDAIGFYVSGQLLTEDYYAANKLMKGVIGSANIDTNSRLCMASSVAGHKRAFGSDTVPGMYEDLELADLVVLVGTNLAWCHPVLFHRLRAARKKRPQMKIILIDPRRTMTAEIADLHLAIKPDGDIALFLGLLAELGEAGCFDNSYIEQHVNGLSDALAQTAGLSMAAIVAATGLETSAIRDFFQIFAQTEKVVTVYSQGVNQSRCGTDKVNAIINCHLATGRIGKLGMGPFSVTGQPNAMGGREVGGLANMLACHMDIENPEHRGIVGNFWKSDRLPTKQGLKAVDLFEAVAAGKIKALWIMATNPVDSMPEANKIRRAIKACPLVIVSDLVEYNDTVELAHIRLPSLAWGEKDGTVTNSERVISRQRAILPAPGEARADWWQMAEVGRRMGFGSLFDWQSSSEIFAEYASLSGHGNGGNRDFDISRHAHISRADYDDLQPFQWPATTDDLVGETKRFFADGGFFTIDGKARMIAVRLPSNWLTGLAENELILNTGRVRDHWHTMTRTARSQTLSAHLAEPYCEISFEDADAHGISDADLVAVTSIRGEIIVRALVTNRVQKGQIFVPIHWTDQFSANARVDLLVSSLRDPVSGQPAAKSAVVSVSRAKFGSYGYAILRHDPGKVSLSYWAKAKIEGGWRMECAFDQVPDRIEARDLGEMFAIPAHADSVIYLDQVGARARYAWFDGDRLIGAIFLASEPVSVSREFVASLLIKKFPTYSKRMQALASVAGADQPDKGKIICACLQVGSNELAMAIAGGCMSVDEVVRQTGAGSNCGSCRPEIKEMLHVVDAAE